MKKTIVTTIAMAVAISVATNVFAKDEKKNPPKSSDVEKLIQEAGGDHFPEKMKVSKVGPIGVGETFYHAYSGSLRKGGYRVLFFDNYQHYLGYYATEFEASDYEEGAVLLDSGDSDEDGNTSYFNLRLGDDGPPEKVRIDGTPSPFVKNEKAIAAKEAEATAKKASTGAEDVQPEYREWTIKRGGKGITFSAIYIKQSGSKVSLKEEKRKITKEFRISDLSQEDQDYLKQFK